MPTTIDIFDNRSLTNGISKVKAFDPFIYNLLFKNQEYHSSDKIDIEITYGSDKLALFVNKFEGAIPIKKGSKTVKTITVPKTWEKKVFEAYELATYKSIQNSIWGTSAEERAKLANEWVLNELQDLKDRVLRRREQLACEAISTGALSISQDNIDFAVDFEFVNDVNLITLASQAKWSASTSDIIKNIRAWKRSIMQLTGTNADICILGSDAADALVSNVAFMKALDNNNYKVGVADLNQNISPSGMYIGRVMGVDFYEYNQNYTKQDGSTGALIDSKKAIMVASSNKGFRTHHAPMFRIDNGELKTYNSEYLVESRTNEDKTFLEWKVEQKSIVAIHEPNAVIAATVV